MFHFKYQIFKKYAINAPMLKSRFWISIPLLIVAGAPLLQAGAATCENLLSDLNRFETFIQSKEFTPEVCEHDLHPLFESIRSSDSNRYALSELKTDSSLLIEKSWQTRQLLRTWLREHSTAAPVSQGCLKAIRDIYRAGRFIEDYLVDRSIQPQLASKTAVLRGSFPITLAGSSGHENFNWKTDLKSGDVLLSRGEAMTSAAIARLGDIDAQFSHAALVYVDPSTQKMYTIEAHIEYGVVVAPFENYLLDGKVRAAVFRQKDLALGAQAAKWMFDYARNYKQKHRENIHYDFSLNLIDHSKVFCSEVVTMAYEAVSAGSYYIPQVQSRLDDLAHTNFLKNLGVTSIESFLPGDLEMDTRFELIAEWRNHLKMRETHLKDTVLTKIYEWIVVHGYEFDPGFKAGFLAKYLVHTARKLPLIGYLFKDKFPSYMPRKTLETIVILQQTAEPILQLLNTRDQAHFKRTGQWMTVAELYQSLDEIRSEDYKKYQSDRDPVFHPYFHP